MGFSWSLLLSPACSLCSVCSGVLPLQFFNLINLWQHLMRLHWPLHLYILSIIIYNQSESSSRYDQIALRILGTFPMLWLVGFVILKVAIQNKT